MKKTVKLMLSVLGCGWFAVAHAAVTITVPMSLLGEQVGKTVGTVTLEDSKYGLLITPHLNGLPPGLHGFHIHANPHCGNDGMAAGGHLDPAAAGKHHGPYDDQGHLGDLPVLYVNEQGDADVPEVAPRLHLSDVKGHTLMIHAGGDNYSDQPEKLGGGGARMACGEIK